MDSDDILDPKRLRDDLTDDDVDELEQLLGGLEKVDATGERIRFPSELHGFLTAVVSGPLVLPSAYMPKIWGDRIWDSTEQSARAMTLVMRMQNEIARALFDEDEPFEPFIDEVESENGPLMPFAELWCRGYVMGTAFHAEQWKARVVDEATAREYIMPIFAIASALEDKVIRESFYEDDAASYRAVVNILGPSVSAIHAWWKAVEGTPLRRAPRPGRNDPCSCGSGKKYKRCCGAI